jgi:hypothetical protein
MPRIIVAVLVMFFVVSCMAVGRSGAIIDLNRPGAFEALQRDNPAHYQKIQQIMAGLSGRPDADVPRWIRTSFDARDVSYAPILLTSDPPQRRLSFALDDSRYQAVLRLTHLRPEIIPAN